VAAALSTDEIARELAACEVTLPAPALEKLSLYLELLLHWNRRINLTGLRDPRVIVRRLFGASLYLARLIELRGWLVDVGSGAGFPGLALKLATPDLKVTLLEPRKRKAAFLKEVIREGGFTITEVVVDRFETWAGRINNGQVAIITTRGVELSAALLSRMAETLSPAGTVAVFTSLKIAQSLLTREEALSWHEPSAIPGQGGSVVLIGSLKN